MCVLFGDVIVAVCCWCPLLCVACVWLWCVFGVGLMGAGLCVVVVLCVLCGIVLLRLCLVVFVLVLCV